MHNKLLINLRFWSCSNNC